MITTLDNLAAGMKWWRNTNWGSDFLNAEYSAIYGARDNGLTQEWWEAAVNRLGQWHAYRGPTRPNTRADIYGRGTKRLSIVSSEYSKLRQSCEGEPCIADLSWEQLAPFFAVAWRIKQSPVFASKMCHLAFPKLFIVMDNQASSAFEYEFYWRGMRDEWNRCLTKEEARKLLTEAITIAKPRPGAGANICESEA